MYILDLLKRSNLDATEASDVAFEYRLLCSGELYNANVITTDWRKSDVTRLLASGPFLLSVCSHPFDDYPQELSLRFKTTTVTETKGSTTSMFYADEEIARDLSSILSLLLRRLITVGAKVREIHPRHYEQEPDYLLDNSIDFVNRINRYYWERKPATIVYGAKGNHDIIDYNPPPFGVVPHDLLGLLTALADSSYAESLVLAARLYSQALRQIEHEADLAYQSLISCVETIANDALRGYQPEETDMVMVKKSVFDKAVELGIGQEQCRALAIEACSGMTWATKKFIKFLVDNAGNDLWEKDDLFRLDPLFCPKKDGLQSAIRSVYSARGGATHGGRPYPPSIAIGIGPTVPAAAFLDLNLDLSNTTLTPIPPIVWFERLVNSAICNFLRRIPTDETAKRQATGRQDPAQPNVAPDRQDPPPASR
ncbi:MAG: hypothetical protein ACYC6Q_05370 [Syntrophales bacterium]